MSTQAGEKTGRMARWLPAAAAALVVGGVAGALALGGGGGDPLTLTVPGENINSSCIQFSLEELASAPVAFGGKVTSVEGATVEIDVDRWYKGGDADTVVLDAPTGMEALIGGIPFEEGESYLITAYAGTVKYCGFSGPATPELQAAFEAAFAG